MATETKSINPSQIIFINPIFRSDETPPSVVDVTGFPVLSTVSSDETIAKFGRFDPDGTPNPTGAYGVESFTVLGQVNLEYTVQNPDLTTATARGVLIVALDDAGNANNDMGFGRVIDKPAA